MSRKPVPRWALLLLLGAALFLPIAVLVVWGVGELLGAMGDAAGGAALRRIALAGGILWALDLLGLLLSGAVNSLTDE